MPCRKAGACYRPGQGVSRTQGQFPRRNELPRGRKDTADRRLLKLTMRPDALIAVAAACSPPYRRLTPVALVVLVSCFSPVLAVEFSNAPDDRPAKAQSPHQLLQVRGDLVAG